MASEITDEFMREMLGKSRIFTVVLLRATPLFDRTKPEQGKIIWEHGRRNFELRAKGIMPLVGPLAAPPIVGISVFATSPDETRALMADDPAVKAGLFEIEIAEWRSFPGDSLPNPAA